MGLSYDRDLIARAFDAYGDQEWERHETFPFNRVSFHIHRHYLTEFIRSNDRVLEVGAGAGRFTVELARLGARVTVTDISPVQLQLNAQHVADARFEEHVESRELADVVDLHGFADDSFDAVVCYGGPLSFAVGHAGQACEELLRVTRPGGHVLLGVMSVHGSLRAFLPGAADEMNIDEIQLSLRTGDLSQDHSSLDAAMHMFSWAELRDLLERQACDVVVTSAANFLSIGNNEVCDRWLEDPVLWETFLGWEIQTCAQPGAIDGGTHIIAVVRKR